MTPAENLKKGYQDGRSGKTQQSKNPDYKRGWKQGEIALEEIQAGYKETRVG